MSSIDLTINIKEFEAEKQKAKKKYNEEYPNDENLNENYLWDDLELDFIEENIEGNDLRISGQMKTSDDKELGWVTFHCPLDLDKLIEIFQSYIKKLNKVKTVMESVKEE